MATVSRITVNGWRVASDATAQARIGTNGWYTVKAAAGVTFKAAWARNANTVIQPAAGAQQR